MADAPKRFDWLSESFQDVVETDPALGGEVATEKLVQDVRAATAKITADTKKNIARIEAEADSQAAKLASDAEDAVKDIRKRTAKAANDLMKETDHGGDARQAAETVQRIISEAEASTAEINGRLRDAVRGIGEQADSATFMLRQDADAALRDLTRDSEKGMAEIAAAIKEIASDHSIGGPEKGRGPDRKDAAAKEGQSAAAKIITSLVRASNSLKGAADEAAENLQAATDEAVAKVRKSATNAVASVHDAIDEANEKVLALTSTAVTGVVGESEAEFYDVQSLKDKWVKRQE